MVSKETQNSVYKIFTEEEWVRFQESGQFSGSSDDLRDGFIHLSTRRQVTGVVEQFFAGRRPLYVAEFSDIRVLQQLKWESSASGEIYPHLYGRDLFANELSGLVKL